MYISINPSIYLTIYLSTNLSISKASRLFYFISIMFVCVLSCGNGISVFHYYERMDMILFGGRGIGEEQDPTHLDQLDQLRSEGIALAAGIWTELMARNYASCLIDQP